MSSEVLTVNQGSLYPALYRLEDRGWIAARAALSDEGRRIRVYRLTAAGRRRLSHEIDSWRLFAAAITQVGGHAMTRSCSTVSAHGAVVSTGS